MFASRPDGSVARTWTSQAVNWGGRIRTGSAELQRLAGCHYPTPQRAIGDGNTAAPRTLPPVPGLTVVILAAGEGTRMRSATPKVLHPLCGRPLVLWPLHAAREAGADRIVVVDGPK